MINEQTHSKPFPADSWVRFHIGDTLYIGRAICRERAQLVATVDGRGHSVTFSWPYLCNNAENISCLDVFEPEVADA